MNISTDVIFRFLPSSGCTTSLESYLNTQWVCVQSSLTQLLLHNHPCSILPLRRALSHLWVRNMHKFLNEHVTLLLYRFFKLLLEQIISRPNWMEALCEHFFTRTNNFQAVSALFALHPIGHESLQQRAYGILCKQLMNQGMVERVAGEIMELIGIYRRIASPEDEQRLQISNKLGLMKRLGIFKCCEPEFLERSKYHFGIYSSAVVRNESIFVVVHEVMCREQELNRILQPTENTLEYLKKDIIEEYYPYMIEFLQYLIQEQRTTELTILWEYTKLINAQPLLQQRMEEIVRDAGKWIERGVIMEVLSLKEKMGQVVDGCFGGNKIMGNIVINSMASVLQEKEQRYSELLSRIILEGKTSLNVMSRLFRLVYNKEQFIKELQVRFFRWVIHENPTDIEPQDRFISTLRKECGALACRHIQRMVFDVWRDSTPVLYSHGVFRCRMLSSEWPVVLKNEINLPDFLIQLRQSFETNFKGSHDNTHKEIRWATELGTIIMSVNGVECTFSEAQAAVVVLVARSIRPLRVEQIQQVLNVDSKQVYQLISELVGVIVENTDSPTFELCEKVEEYRMRRVQEKTVEGVRAKGAWDGSLLVEAAIVRILKKKKSMQRTDIGRLLMETIVNFKPTPEQIHNAFQKLIIGGYIEVDRAKGGVKYVE